MNDSDHELVPRPGVVTFVGVVLWIQAAVAAVSSASVLLFRNGDEFQEGTGQSAEALLGLAIAEAVIAVVLAIVASGILRGSRTIRGVVGVVMGLRIALSMFYMITHHQGGFLDSGIVNIAVALFVLWALFVNEQSDEWFGPSDMTVKGPYRLSHDDPGSQ